MSGREWSRAHVMMNEHRDQKRCHQPLLVVVSWLVVVGSSFQLPSPRSSSVDPASSPRAPPPPPFAVIEPPLRS